MCFVPQGQLTFSTSGQTQTPGISHDSSDRSYIARETIFSYFAVQRDYLENNAIDGNTNVSEVYMYECYTPTILFHSGTGLAKYKSRIHIF